MILDNPSFDTSKERVTLPLNTEETMALKATITERLRDAAITYTTNKPCCFLE